MSYTKNTWNAGDVVTAEKLNHMEDGIKSVFNLSSWEPVFEITFAYGEGEARLYPNKTYSEIMDIYEEEGFPDRMVCSVTTTDINGNIYGKDMPFFIIYDYEQNEFVFSPCGLSLLQYIYYDHINFQFIADFPVWHLSSQEEYVISGGEVLAFGTEM